LKKQKESESTEIKKSALEDSSNEMSDDENKKDCNDKTESNHSKIMKSVTSAKKNPLQNTAKLGKLIILLQNSLIFCQLFNYQI
jgi:hypothetical protein